MEMSRGMGVAPVSAVGMCRNWLNMARMGGAVCGFPHCRARMEWTPDTGNCTVEASSSH